MGGIPYITTLCLNGTPPCVDFMDVIMGGTPYITTLCVNGTLPCVDFLDVIMGGIPYITTLCLNGSLSCVHFMSVCPHSPSGEDLMASSSRLSSARSGTSTIDKAGNWN